MARMVRSRSASLGETGETAWRAEAASPLLPEARERIVLRVEPSTVCHHVRQ